MTIDASGSPEKIQKAVARAAWILWVYARRRHSGGGELEKRGASPPLAKYFGYFQYKIVPFPDTWDKLLEI